MALITEINMPDGNGNYTVVNPVTSVDAISEWSRQKNKAYAQKSTAYCAGLPAGYYLECITAGTTANADITLPNSLVENTTFADGSATWMIRRNFALEINCAGSHNGIYRGKDLTAYFNDGEMSAAIAAGTFNDIFIGDYITKTINLPAITYKNKAGASVTQAAQTFDNVKWLVAGLDSYLHSGYLSTDTTNYGETTAHHVVLIPASTLQRNVCMNVKVSNADTTEGGYKGSEMWTAHMPNWTNAIKTAFGTSHVLSYYDILTNGVNTSAASAAGCGWTGSSNGWEWTQVTVNIPNEPMIYGGTVFSSSGMDVGCWNKQLPLYQLKNRHLDDRSWFWLRSVASSSAFACADNNGRAYCGAASLASSSGGIRPFFLLV